MADGDMPTFVIGRSNNAKNMEKISGRLRGQRRFPHEGVMGFHRAKIIHPKTRPPESLCKALRAGFHRSGVLRSDATKQQAHGCSFAKRHN